MAGFTSIDNVQGTLLQGTVLLNCKAGVIGASAGVAQDTSLFGVYIQFAAGPPTLTIGGQFDNTGTAQTMIVTGSTTADYFWMPPAPILNWLAPWTFTPSVAGKIWVFLKAYIGPP